MGSLESERQARRIQRTLSTAVRWGLATVLLVYTWGYLFSGRGGGGHGGRSGADSERIGIDETPQVRPDVPVYVCVSAVSCCGACLVSANSARGW